MKYIIFFFTSTYLLTLNAAQIICQSNPRDVAVRVNWIGDEISILVKSPMGYSQLPLIDGPVRPSLIDWSRYQIQQLEPLGSQFEVRFNRNECVWTLSRFKSGTKIECGGKSTVSPKELLFTSFSLTRIVESTLKDEYFTRRFRMTVIRKGDLGDDTFFVTIPVSESGCQDYE